MVESWSFHFEGNSGEQRYHGGRTDYDCGSFRGAMERVELRPGLNLYAIDGVSSHPYVLSPRAVMPRGSIGLGAMLGGEGKVRAEGAPEQSWREQQSFFALNPETQISYHIRPGKRWGMVGLILAPEVLEDLANENDLPQQARNAMGGSGQPFCTMRPLKNAAMAHVARDLLKNQFRGRMASLHRQARSLEYLGLLMGALDAAPVAEALTALETRRIREARDRLVADLRNPPDLHALAYAVGLGVKRLNEGFRLVYGTTVFDYLRDARLEAARDALDNNPGAPLKQIAWQVGYAHTTNFINAYRRRFGAPPARDRRRRA